MSTTLSAKVKAALFAQSTSGADIVLLTISHPSITTLYLTNNNVNLMYGGQLYTAVTFVLDWHAETSDSVASASLTTYNDTALMAALRSVGDFITIAVQAVWYDESASLVLDGSWALDGSERLDGTGGVFEPVKGISYIVKDIDYDDEVIQASLAIDDALDYEMLPIELTPQVAPGLFV
ncbi:MAG TPA: hypothetical protein VN437_05940 [Rectinemataceae bacterium]|nr:hypothetical protein [Rectinemataceae bacterium]